MTNPAIVVVAYNRPESLKRLLVSLSKALYKSDVTLIISIDFCALENSNVNAVANNFTWEFGDKIVLNNKTNLGLRKHVIKCGDLTSDYDTIIMLEDDLIVSPYFYQYAQESVSFYSDDENIGGISLYCHQVNVNCKKRFEPLADGYDVFWLMFASSWGQIWTSNQWLQFKSWYLDKTQAKDFSLLSDYINKWPESSWLKYFNLYLLQKNKYFIYPRCSYSTNFSDVGTNVKKSDTTYMVNLVVGEKVNRFSTRERTNSIYDSYFELLPEVIKSFKPELKHLEFEVDLYGSKDFSKIKSEFVISTKKYSSEPLAVYNKVFWPHDLNLIMQVVDGASNDKKDIFMLSKVNATEHSISASNKNILYYNHPISTKELLSVLFTRLLGKII